MRIKKYLKNDYIFTDGFWVRDFTKPHVKELSINTLYPSKEYSSILNNELENAKQEVYYLHNEHFNLKNVVIVSDGYDFAKLQETLCNLPSDTHILAVNGALRKWKINKDVPYNKRRSISLYVANNPFKDCEAYLPKETNYYPPCALSTKTNPRFAKGYKGNKFFYIPTDEREFCSIFTKEVAWHIDDYRNPICAAIGIAYRFNVKKLLLFCCDNSFEQERPAAIQLPNKLWHYPQHTVSHNVIDANLYWLTNQEDNEVKVGNCSNGLEYKNASQVEDIANFFKSS